MGPSKLRNSVFLRKCLKWNSNFQNWSKALCLVVSEPTKRLAAQSMQHALCVTDKVNWHLSKKMKTISV